MQEEVELSLADRTFLSFMDAYSASRMEDSGLSPYALHYDEDVIEHFETTPIHSEVAERLIPGYDEITAWYAVRHPRYEEDVDINAMPVGTTGLQEHPLGFLKVRPGEDRETVEGDVSHGLFVVSDSDDGYVQFLTEAIEPVVGSEPRFEVDIQKSQLATWTYEATTPGGDGWKDDVMDDAAEIGETAVEIVEAASSAYADRLEERKDEGVENVKEFLEREEEPGDEELGRAIGVLKRLQGKQQDADIVRAKMP